MATTTIAANLSDVVIDYFGGRPSPIDCSVLKFFTVYSIFMFSTSFICNAILLYAFIKNKDLRSPINMFIIALTVTNLFATVSEASVIIPSTFACKWVSGKAGCYISGFIMYTAGLMQINIITAISIERYYIIYKPLNIKKIDFKTAFLITGGCLAFSTLFTVPPLIGWSYYSLESSLIQCGVEWAERSWNVQSFNMTIFFFNYIVPISLIGYCSFHLLKIVKEMPNMAKDDEKAKQRIANERQLTVNMLTYIAIFIIAWTPYMLVSLMSCIFGHDAVDPLGSFIPSMFAKSSMAISAVFFIYTNKAIRSTLFGEPAAAAKKEVTRTDSDGNA